MDLIETLSVLADAVDSLTKLAVEQATIIEQYQMVERETSEEHRRRLAELDEQIMRMGTFAWKRKEEGG